MLLRLFNDDTELVNMGQQKGKQENKPKVFTDGGQLQKVDKLETGDEDGHEQNRQNTSSPEPGLDAGVLTEVQ